MKPRLPLLVTLVTLVAGAGCGPAAEAPEVRSLSPAWGWTGETTSVTVTGQRFYPALVVGDNKEEAQFDTTFQVFLDASPSVALDPVQFVDTSTLEVQVPAGVTPGVYDLRVVDPAGVEATLADAFRVTETRADHLAFDVDTVGYDVTELASLGMRLADPEDGAVAEPLLVEVRATSEEGATGLEFGDGLLDNQEALEDGVGVRGNLHADGTATLLLRSSTAQDLTLTLTSIDQPLVTEATTLLSFSPGVPDRVVLTLPSDDFSTVAGDEIPLGIEVVDALGNVIDANGLTVVLFEDSDCGDLRQSVDLLQAGPYPVTLTTACEGNHLHAFGLGSEEAVSEGFDVLAGPMSTYEVHAVPRSVVAGSGVLAVQVDAVDAWANVVASHVATIELTDSVGGLDPDAGVGTQQCNSFLEGQAFCTATPTRSGSAVTLTATDELGRAGVSNEIEVLPDTATQVIVALGVAVAEAGVPFNVMVQLEDAWGNAISYESDAAVITDDTGKIECEAGGEGSFSCVVTESTSADVITATLFGLQGSSIGVTVTNSDLAIVDVAVSKTEVVAGESLVVSVEGFDAYGNAYTTAVSGSAVDITDLLGGIGAPTINLDASGYGSATVSLVVTGVDVVSAGQGGVVLGSSEPVTVQPGAMVDLVVTAAAWADVDAPVPTSVVAVDAFGNAVDTYVGPVDVRLDGCADQVAASFEDGQVEVDFECTTPVLQAQVVADDGVFAATSSPIDLLDFGCSPGPVADVLLDGTDEVIACTVSGVASLAVDTSGSVAGASPLVAWHLDDGDASTRTTSAPTTLEFDAAGARRVTLVIADADACGSEASAVAWIGDDDGSPTGPIVATPAGSVVHNGSGTTVTFAAKDCAGDVASGGLLYVRTDLGELGGATSTGSGLAVTLDSFGYASVSVSYTAGYAAVATVSGSSDSGGGYGAATITVLDDSVRPTVASATPAGTWSGTVTDLTVEFSEPMLPANFTASTVALTGPAGNLSVALALSNDNRTLTVTPATQLDAGSGTFVLSLTSNVRDAAGNRLSGDWSGSSAAWSVSFGAVADATPTGSCVELATTFRPDGDDGAGVDADDVSIALTASASPTWWAFTVSDADGVPVLRTRDAGTGSSVTWDGRSDDGLVVPAGDYTVAIDAVDGNGNASRACDTPVVVDLRGATP